MFDSHYRHRKPQKEENMKLELDEKLCKDFPILYRNRHASMQISCMHWGFDIGDGWEPIIREASEKLEKIAAAMPDDENRMIAAQVKEKFGVMRLYVDCYPADETLYEEVKKIVDEAEAKTEVTCETCGQEGSSREHHRWYVTLCESCFEGYKKDRP